MNRKKLYLRGLATALVMAVVVSACDFEVLNPGPVQDENLEFKASHEGMVYGAIKATQSGLGAYNLLGGAVTHDVMASGHTGSAGVRPEEEVGRFTDEYDGRGSWGRLHRGRWIAEEAIRRFASNEEVTVGSYGLAATAHLWAGIASRTLGESACTAVFDGGAPQGKLDNFSDEHLEQLVDATQSKSADNIFEQIGLGNRVAYLTARQLLTLRDQLSDDDDNAPPATSQRQTMVIHGTEGFLVNFARCCYPIPGDHIVGIVSAEKGVVVHCENCHNSIDLRNTPERVVPLSWADDIDRDFSVELKVELSKQRGIIAVLATRVNGAEASIEKISVEDENPKISTIHLVIGVRSRVHLASIMRRIRNIPAVIKVTREKH